MSPPSTEVGLVAVKLFSVCSNATSKQSFIVIITGVASTHQTVYISILQVWQVRRYINNFTVPELKFIFIKFFAAVGIKDKPPKQISKVFFTYI